MHMARGPIWEHLQACWHMHGHPTRSGITGPGMSLAFVWGGALHLGKHSPDPSHFVCQQQTQEEPVKGQALVRNAHKQLWAEAGKRRLPKDSSVSLALFQQMTLSSHDFSILGFS